MFSLHTVYIKTQTRAHYLLLDRYKQQLRDFATFTLYLTGAVLLIQQVAPNIPSNFSSFINCTHHTIRNDTLVSKKG